MNHENINKIPILGSKLAKIVSINKATIALSKHNNSAIISHGPRTGYHTSKLISLKKLEHKPHLLFSFNFTNPPNDTIKKEYILAFKRITKFTVFSTMEKQLYSKYFEIEESKIDMIHWGVQPHDRSKLPKRQINTPYVCAVGSQGRDYQVLADSARLLPKIPFHWVVHNENIKGINIPDNVTLHKSISFDEAASIVAHASLMALPLLHNEVPCGHVTTVMGMHLSCPIVATESKGLEDYIKSGLTAQTVEPQNAAAFAKGIEELWDNSELAKKIGQNGKYFATKHCQESSTIGYFDEFIQNLIQTGQLQGLSDK